MRSRTRARRAVSSLMPASSMKRSTRTSGSSISCQQVLEPALGMSSRCWCGERRARAAAASASGVLRVDGQPALLGELVRAGSRAARGRAGRRRPPCRRRGWPGTRPSALASWATTARAPAAATSSAGSAHVARPAPRRRRRRRRSASARRRGEQLALGDLGRARRRARARSPASAATSRTVAPRGPAGAARPAASGPRDRLLARRPRAPPRAAAAGRAARSSRNTSRRRERSGSRVGLLREVEVDRDVADRSSPAAWRCARPRRGRSRFSLRLAPEIWSTLRQHRPRGRRTAAAAATAVLSPMPGTPGMLSDVSPLSPKKSGTSSGAMP